MVPSAVLEVGLGLGPLFKGLGLRLGGIFTASGLRLDRLIRSKPHECRDSRSRKIINECQKNMKKTLNSNQSFKQ